MLFRSIDLSLKVGALHKIINKEHEAIATMYNKEIQIPNPEVESKGIMAFAKYIVNPSEYKILDKPLSDPRTENEARYDMMKLSKFFNIQYSRIFYIYSRLLDEARNFGVKTYAKPMHTDEPDVITKMSDPKFRGLMSILQGEIDKATSEDDKKKYTIMKIGRAHV